MIAAVDIETRGLNAQNFILGVCITEENRTPQVFKNKKKLWQHIINLGRAQAKRNRKLTVYSHNAAYDFYGYAPFPNKNIEIYSARPFIAGYKENGKDIISFLDSMGIYQMSLQRTGELIRLPKADRPGELLEEDASEEEIKKKLPDIEKYCIRDTEIVMEAIQVVKTKLKNDGINIKRLFTINQIAINYLLRELKDELKDENVMFANPERNQVHPTNRPQYVHSAYRGGRAEAFQTGSWEKATYIDINSLYPYAATQIRFPDLSTEATIRNPLDFYTIEQLLKYQGVIKCMMKNESNRVGLLPLYQERHGNYYPRPGQYMIGTWTLPEIKAAINNGYTLIEADTAIIYADAQENPFYTIMNRLYQKRIQEKDAFDRYFYKCLMNCGIGKLGQHRVNQKIVVDDIMKAPEYYKNGYDSIRGIQGYQYIYIKTDVYPKRKPYYAPIIPATITAQARIIMNQHMLKLKSDDLLYTDTDSIIFTGDNLKYYDIGDGLGQFSVVGKDKPVVIYGNKTYMYDDDVKVAGMRNASTEDFKQGTIHSKKMQTVHTTTDPKVLGTFTNETRVLRTVEDEHRRVMTDLFASVILMDKSTKDISKFLPYIKKIT